jgi:hypothetical protein
VSLDYHQLCHVIAVLLPRTTTFDNNTGYGGRQGTTKEERASQTRKKKKMKRARQRRHVNRATIFLASAFQFIPAVA